MTANGRIPDLHSLDKAAFRPAAAAMQWVRFQNGLKLDWEKKNLGWEEMCKRGVIYFIGGAVVVTEIHKNNRVALKYASYIGPLLLGFSPLFCLLLLRRRWRSICDGHHHSACRHTT